VHVAPGDAVQLSFTGVPAVSDAVFDEIATLMGAVPASGTTTGTPVLVTVRPPVRSPAAAGLKVTLTAHVPLGGSDGPQLLVCKKLLDVEIPSTASGVVPPLVIVST
jgi:hypothetical protein